MHFFFVLIYCILTFFLGCSQTAEPTLINKTLKSQGDRDGQLIEAYLNELVDPAFSRLQTELTDLKQSLRTQCDNQEGPLLETWQLSWQKAMFEFHYLNVLVLGPLTQSQDSTPLRFIYSHPPQRSPSFIAREIQKAQRLGSNYKQTRPLAHSLGFQALEYLFFENLPHSSQSSLTLGACHYTNYVIENLQQQIQDYQQSWNDAEVLYLLSPEGQTRLPESIGRLAGHLIVHTRDIVYGRGLAAPLMIENESLNCTSVHSCLEEHLEHPFASDRKIKVSASLQALQDIFNGRTLTDKQKTYSFRDYFQHLRQSTSHPLDQLRRLQEEWQDIPSIESFLLSENENPAAHPNMLNFLVQFQQFNFWMSTDFLVDLNANLPKSVQGDND